MDREDMRLVEAEEQYAFIRNVLIAMNLPLDGCFPESEKFSDFTLDHKCKLREVLEKFNVLILDDKDGKIEIYIESPPEKPELVAKWNKCRFDLRQDLSALDPKKRIYAVMHVDYWSVFEKD